MIKVSTEVCGVSTHHPSSLADATLAGTGEAKVLLTSRVWSYANPVARSSHVDPSQRTQGNGSGECSILALLRYVLSHTKV